MSINYLEVIMKLIALIFCLMSAGIVEARIGAEQPDDAYSIARRKALMKPAWAYIMSFETNETDKRSKATILFERSVSKTFFQNFRKFLEDQEIWRNNKGSGGGTSMSCKGSICEVLFNVETSMTKDELQSLIDKANKHFSDQ